LGDRAAGDLPLGKRPADDLADRLTRSLDHDGLPLTPFAEEPEAGNQPGEPGERLDIVVSDDTEDVNARRKKLANRSLEVPDRLVTGVRALDHVAGEYDGIDLFVDGKTNRRLEACRRRKPLEIDAPIRCLLRNACGASAQVDVTDRKELGHLRILHCAPRSIRASRTRQSPIFAARSRS
jgi:hypothetical protein